MYKTNVITNHIPRLLSYWEDVPKAVRESQFDYHEEGSWGRESALFFKYRGVWYDSSQGGGAPNIGRWEASQHHTVWDGIFYRDVEMNEGRGVVVGHYYTTSA